MDVAGFATAATRFLALSPEAPIKAKATPPTETAASTPTINSIMRFIGGVLNSGLRRALRRLRARGRNNAPGPRKRGVQCQYRRDARECGRVHPRRRSDRSKGPG